MSIKAEHITHIYSQGLPGETVAIDDLTFEIKDGEFVGIIGHTGSGKSTLLQHLNGLLSPTSGDLFFDGESMTGDKKSLTGIRKQVGLVFQYPEYQLFEETVAKDVAFGPKNLGIDGDALDDVVKMAIETVGLPYDEVKDRSPFELSGGQKRRVAIAGVIAMEPKVLILDEPTAGLDPEAHAEILKMVMSIHESRNITIIFVSHNMADIAAMADRVMVMDGGKIVYDGTPEEVFSKRKELADIGLGVPPVTEIMKEIEERIPEIDGNVLSMDGAERELRKYFEGKGVIAPREGAAGVAVKTDRQ